MKRQSDQRALIQAVAFALLFIFAAHAFCFFNVTLSSGSVMVNVADNANVQTESGQYLQPFYWRIRGEVSVPLWVGLLSTLYLTACAVIVVWLLGLQNTLSIAAVCDTLTVGAAVTAICAASLHTADAVFLSMLLALLAAALCLRTRFGFLPGAAFFAASLALDSGGLACGVSLALIVLAKDILDEAPFQALIVRAGKTVLSLLFGAGCYMLGLFVMLRRSGLESTAVLQPPAGGMLWGMWLYPIRTLLSPLTAYETLNCLLRAALAILALLSLITLRKKLAPARIAALVLIALLLPLAVNLPAYAAQEPGQTRLAFCLLDVFLIVLIFAQKDWRTLQKTGAGAFGVLFLGSIVFSNQVYLKKNLERDSTLSVMTRVLDRIEQTEGFVPGETTVAILGTLDDSALSVTHKGFEHLSAFEAAQSNYAIATAQDTTWYLWEILGYPVSLATEYEQSLLLQREDVQSMPAFPQEGCCRFVEGMLVVKLSE